MNLPNQLYRHTAGKYIKGVKLNHEENRKFLS
jgi:hypothetical protein